MTGVKRSMMAAAGQAGDNLYVEDVFSTYLYEGNGTSQTIVNDIDLDGEGGMVWIKQRSLQSHALYDTDRGTQQGLASDLTAAETDATVAGRELYAFTSSGFSVGPAQNRTINDNTEDYASWTFRKQAGFFDVVTYTGNGSNRTISHSLGSVPAFIVVKRTDVSGNFWYCYHSSIGNTKRIWLNDADPAGTDSTVWNSTTPTDSVFSLGTNVNVNASGGSYVAYLFASDAGGFGADSDESIIKCGTFTTDGSFNATVDLGWEPQYVITKQTSSGNWQIGDIMRGLPTLGVNGEFLAADTSGAAYSFPYLPSPNATGFDYTGVAASLEFIYIAIRRPMKVPEAGTEVFAMDDRTATEPAFTAGGWPVDMTWQRDVDSATNVWISSRLQGANELNAARTTAEAADAKLLYDYMDGWHVSDTAVTSIYSWMFKRAPEFMDVVAYTGTGVARAEAHGLGVVPELMIIKARNLSDNWAVYHKDLGDATASRAYSLLMNLTNGKNNWGSYQLIANQTATDFYLGTNNNVNGAYNYIAYLFATLDGVSKVGSYTADATLTTIDCGFTAGARFVVIKRTDSTGGWYCYDSTRGIVAGNDPYILLNDDTAAQVTGTDYIDPDNSGFQLTAAGSSTINVSGGEYIYLSIA